jgi:hypothetical protein
MTANSFGLSANLTGQVALVTGASQGLGQAVAIRLGLNGAKVLCVARNAEKLADTVEQIKAGGGDAIAIACDVTDRASIEKLFEVGPGSFRPPPKVQSAVIRLLPISQPRAVVKDEHVFARLVAHAFSRRRKMLKNAFEDYLDQDAILSVGLDPEARPETIDVEGFVRAANHVATARGAAE